MIGKNEAFKRFASYCLMWSSVHMQTGRLHSVEHILCWFSVVLNHRAPIERATETKPVDEWVRCARNAKKKWQKCCYIEKGIVDALVNMVASQSEDNHVAIIQFVASEMRKSHQMFALILFSVWIACERNENYLIQSDGRDDGRRNQNYTHLNLHA